MRKRGNDEIKSIDVPVYDLNVSKIDTISQIGTSLYEYIDELVNRVYRSGKIYEVVKTKDSF